MRHLLAKVLARITMDSAVLGDTTEVTGVQRNALMGLSPAIASTSMPMPVKGVFAGLLANAWTFTARCVQQ